MGIIEKSISGESEYDTTIDKINRQQRELVKLYYLTDDIEARKVIDKKLNQLNSERSTSGFWNFVKTIVVYLLIFALLVVNFFAVSLSLSCNKGSNIIFKIVSAIFALLFGIIYIIINFRVYKVQIGEYCEMCKQNPFPFFF